MEDISGEEVRTGLRKMKKGKAQGPDDIPVEVWIAVGNKGVEFLENFFNRLLQGEKTSHSFVTLLFFLPLTSGWSSSNKYPGLENSLLFS